jgi:hypothetical protein
MGNCAVSGCESASTGVWDSNEGRAPRFDHPVCGMHSLELRAGARYTIDGRLLHINTLTRLLGWTVSQPGGHPVVSLSYGEEFDPRKLDLQADPAMLKELGDFVRGLYPDVGEP